MRKIKLKISPFAKILISFAIIILIGATLFSLPVSTTGSPMGFINALFMSTSSVCVTGLSVLGNLSVDLTFFGQLVMVILMAIGGLGFLTLSTFFFMIIGAKLDLSDRFLMREVWNMESSKGIIKLVRNIVLFALGVQVVGTIANFCILLKYFEPGSAIWKAIFQSVSAFNNVGFDILGNSNSMVNYSTDVLLNLSTMLLIIIGGLGFVTIFDIFKNKFWKKYSLTTKVVLLMTPVLIIVGGLLFKFCMWNEFTWLQSFFSSVASRTSGFSTVDMSTLSSSAYIIMIILMYIGASPCSTGGGIKTTTFLVLLVTMKRFATGKKPVLFKRTLPGQTIKKATSLFIFSITYILFATFLISIFDPSLGIRELLFEVVSAFGTVGFSMGITAGLSVASKIVLIITMFIGRIGTITIMNIANNKWLSEEQSAIEYVEERIIVG